MTQVEHGCYGWECRCMIFQNQSLPKTAPDQAEVLPYHCQLCTHWLPCVPGQLRVPNVEIYSCVCFWVTTWLHTWQITWSIRKKTDSFFEISSSLHSMSSLVIISLIKLNIPFLFSYFLRKPLFQSRFGTCVFCPHPCLSCTSVMRLSQG